MYATEHEKL